MNSNLRNLALAFLTGIFIVNCTADTDLVLDASEQLNDIQQVDTASKDSVVTDAPDPTKTDSTQTLNNGDLNSPQEIKDYVTALFDRVGRVSTNALKNPNSTNLPNGIVVSGSIITIKVSDIVLEDFNFDGYTIFLHADNVTLRNNVFGETAAPRFKKRILDIRGDVKNFVVEDNDFNGFQGLGSGVGSAIFQRILTSTEEGTGGAIRRNRFKHFSNDIIKTSGGVVIEENVLYGESNVKVLPSPKWEASKTYALNEVVKDIGGQKHFISLIANNQGNTLPALGDSDGNWEFYDPHCDMVNPFDNTKPSTIRRNLFIRNTQHTMLPSNDRSYAVGLTNAIRVVRNNSDNSRSFEALLIEENVILGTEFYGGGAIPIEAASSGGAWVNPTFKNNLIDMNARGVYTHPNTPSSVDWQENYNASSLVRINP